MTNLRNFRNSELFAGTIGCGFLIGIFIIYCLVAWFCFDYCLLTIFGKDIPWYLDIICGIVFGEFIIPATVVIFILKIAGLAVPFIVF